MNTTTATKTRTSTWASHDGHTMTYSENGYTCRFDCTCGFSTDDGFYGHSHA
jgi:hypothetical protein